MPDQAQSLTRQPRRLLVRGVNWLGDAVMTTPALQRLREALPETHITMLTREELAPLWKQHPSLNAVVSFRARERPWAVAKRLRAEGFDTALVLPNSPRSALEVWLARIPQRIGYARPWRNWFLTRAVPTRPGQHRMRKRSQGEVRRLIQRPVDDPQRSPLTRPAATLSPSDGEREGVRGSTAHQTYEYLHLSAILGASPEPLPPRLEVAAAVIDEAEQSFLSHLRGKATGPPLRFLGLNPGAQYGPAKRWPPESFAAVARAVSSRAENCLWLALGSEGDEKLCADIARLAGGGVVNLAGKTSLLELMALLKLCRVLLTNDSGPMHVAAALGTPVVVPFGSTSPDLTGPGLPGDARHRLLTSAAPCAPCFRRTCPIDLRCMTGISPDRVTEAVLQVLAAEMRQG
jgi:heptosyltransferase II